MPDYKTPGVYVTEIGAFPASVVGVATSVPLFVGHSEKAEDQGRSLAGQPCRIGSMADYRHSRIS